MLLLPKYPIKMHVFILNLMDILKKHPVSMCLSLKKIINWSNLDWSKAIISKTKTESDAVFN